MPALSIFLFQSVKRSPLSFSIHEDLWIAILAQDEEKVKGTVKILDRETVKHINNLT